MTFVSAAADAMHACNRAGRPSLALDIFEAVREHGAVGGGGKRGRYVVNAALQALRLLQNAEGAISLVAEIYDEYGLLPDDAGLVTVVAACRESGAPALLAALPPLLHRCTAEHAGGSAAADAARFGVAAASEPAPRLRSDALHAELIRAYGQAGQAHRSLRLFDSLVSSELPLRAHVYSHTLHALSSCGAAYLDHSVDAHVIELAVRKGVWADPLGSVDDETVTVDLSGFAQGVPLAAATRYAIARLMALERSRARSDHRMALADLRDLATERSIELEGVSWAACSPPHGKGADTVDALRKCGRGLAAAARCGDGEERAEARAGSTEDVAAAERRVGVAEERDYSYSCSHLHSGEPERLAAAPAGIDALSAEVLVSVVDTNGSNADQGRVRTVLRELARLGVDPGSGAIGTLTKGADGTSRLHLASGSLRSAALPPFEPSATEAGAVSRWRTVARAFLDSPAENDMTDWVLAGLARKLPTSEALAEAPSETWQTWERFDCGAAQRRSPCQWSTPRPTDVRPRDGVMRAGPARRRQPPPAGA